MTTPQAAMLLNNLRRRRDSIAADWHQTLIRICDFPPAQPVLYQSLVQLTDQLLTVICADVFDAAAAQSIGMRLAALGCAQAEALGRTQTLLMQTLVAELAPEARTQVQQRLAMLIGELAIGFCRWTGETLPARQERIGCECLADRRQVPAGEAANQTLFQALLVWMFRIGEHSIYLDFQVQHGQQTIALSEIVGKQIDQALPPELAALTTYHIQQALQTHTTQIFEYRLRCDERLRAYEARIVYLKADAVLMVARDITNDQQAERALRLSQECLHTVVTNVPLILFSFDRGGVFTLAAGKGLEKLGLTPDQVVGCSVCDLCGKVPGFLANLRRAQAGEAFTALERANKAVFETTYIPYYDADGAVASVVGVATDITERARAEAQLAGAHQRLAERQESERLHLARELHDSAVQQLLSVKYQLEALQRSLGQIHGDERRSAMVDQLLVAAQREVLSVVSQLRGMIGELRPAGLEELGLIAALEGYISNLQHQHKTSLPKIELDLGRRGGSLPQPIALCLFRVIQEAYRNTLKHAQAGVINTRLRVHADAVVLTIRDNGCGFTVPTCLSQFTRSNHFGLAGMTERVALVRGQLTIHSQPAIGTELIVRIPLQQMEEIDG